MKTTTIFTFALVAAFASISQAAELRIFATDVDLIYDTPAIFDAGGNGSGTDALQTVEVSLDGTQVGPTYTSGSLNLNIDGVTGIPAAGGTVVSTGPGELSLQFDDGTDFYNVDLTLADVEVIYNPVGGVDFVFSADPDSAIVSQFLPAGLLLEEPVRVSLSTTANPGSIQTDTGVLTAFTSSGTAEITSVPEPTSIALVALAGMFATMAGSRYRLG